MKTATHRGAASLALFLLLLPASCHRQSLRGSPTAVAPAAQTDWAAYVDPFIGTGGHGHTYPGATVPFGMVQLSPDTKTQGWDWCSGYHASDTSIMGFSHTHLSGTGGADLGDVLLMPSTGAPSLEPGPAENPDAGYRSRFSHQDESAAPGYYAVKLSDTGIKAELTATERAGFHRYTFPAAPDAHIVLDLQHGISDKPTDTSLAIEGTDTVTGVRRSRGWAKDHVIYFVAKFSKPFARVGTSDGGPLVADQKQVSGAAGVKAVLGFTTTANEAILVKVAISSVDLDGARKNLSAEIPAWDFEGTRAAARRAWNAALGKIEIQDDKEKGQERDKKIFYTSLYHALLAPTLFSDVDGRYRGSDMAVHQANGFHYYSTFSLWDTFRAAHPLYTLVAPERIPDMVNSLIVQGEQHPQRQIPIWPLASWETRTMIGQHSIPVIVDAYLKGFRGFDINRAWALIKENAARIDEWRKLGYFPADKEKEAVSKTLEFAYDDWAVATLAKALGKQEDYALYAKGAQVYKNLWDQESGFMRPKLQDGSWRTPFDPRALTRAGGGRDYTEGNAWQHTWFVPQDVPGLITLMGGREAFTKRLDELFSTTSELSGNKVLDVTGLIGQYAHGNEPDHHVAFLYDYAGQPWKTQARVREILGTLYKDAPDGLSGNEDCGQMSAWYVLAALGIYPVNPADGVYVLSSPIFGRAVLHGPAGKDFTIRAVHPESPYIQAATLGGEALPRPWIRHADLVAGGTLGFNLGAAPNTAWGTKPEEAPPTLR